jgi:peptide/nickel transport system permease protein
MYKLIRNRLLLAIPTLFVVSVISYVLQGLIPGNVAQLIGSLQDSPAAIAKLARQMGLDRPLYQQYWTWLDGVFHGSLGHSLLNGQSVISEIHSRLPVTLSLVGLATFIATVLGILLGILSARGGRFLKHTTDAVSIFGMATPSFWLALIVISLFSVRFKLLPSFGYVDITTSFSGWLKSLILPAIALGLAGVTSIAKLTRDGMLDTANRDFIRNLRANGVSERSIVFKHCLRNSLAPVLTMVGLVFINSLGAAVIIEQIFSLPGLGSLAVSATFNHDIPSIQGVAVCFTVLVIAMNLIVDILYAWVNPKVRVQ